MKREGSENWLDGIDVGDDSKPAFVDLDGDGDLDFVAGEARRARLLRERALHQQPEVVQRQRHLRRPVVLLPLCNCLTGIAGAQCDRCQTATTGRRATCASRAATRLTQSQE